MLRRIELCLVVIALSTVGLAQAIETRAEDSPATTQRAAATIRPVLTSIGVVKGTSGTQIILSGDGALPYEYFVIEGRNLVIDLPGAGSSVWPAEQAIDDDFISRVRVSEQSGEKAGVRVGLDLKRPSEFTVSKEGDKILVSFSAERIPAPAAPIKASAPAVVSSNRVTRITNTKFPGTFRITVRTDETPSYHLLKSGDPKKILIALDGLKLEPGLMGAGEYSDLNTPVLRIGAVEELGSSPAVLITIELREPLPFSVFTDVAGLNLELKTAASTATNPPPRIPPAVATALGTIAPKSPALHVPDPLVVAERTYTGGKITLDFVDAEIADIFRLIAEVSGKNIVASDDVKGRRSVRMTDVPWDQALELILKTNNPQLTQVTDGENVLRILTRSRQLLEQSEIEERKVKELQLQENARKMVQMHEAALEEELLNKGKRQRREEFTAKAIRDPLKEYILSLNNSEMADVWPGIRSYLEEQEVIKGVEVTAGKTVSTVNPSPVTGTPAGVVAGTTQLEQTTIEFRINEETCPGCLLSKDSRTKTFYFRMYPAYMEKVLYIIQTLDAPKKIDSVVIEARIVEVMNNFSQSLGIQWGGTFVADAAHGNSTKYAFPNSIGIGGTQPGNYLVNLPAANAVGGIGLSLGHVADTLSLDVKLSALETLGKTKILSNPKILTLNKMAAKINIGSQLPIPSTDATGNRSVSWKDVGILLDVTPEITSDDKVVMKVNIEKSSKGVTVATTEGDMFSIERRGASTNVIVADGETTVIGGIYIQSETGNTSGIPWFAKIPLLGWLFKSNAKGSDRTELMIFLTPKINRYQ